MSVFEQYYDLNPIGVIDQDSWDYRYPEVALQFRNNSVYTPLIDWTNDPAKLGVTGTVVTELLDGDTNADEIPMSAMYIDAQGIDSRSRSYTVKRYGGKVQVHKYESLFTQWQKSGGRDWRPLLRGVLGQDIVRKHEILARNIFLQSDKTRWTYAGAATNFATIDKTADKFNLDVVIDWNFRLGNYGTSVVPGDAASAKVAIIPPGITYDLRKSLKSASNNEASMWRDARIYAGQSLRYEIGEFSGVRFVEAPNDKYGINPAVLYNAGAITGIGAQYGCPDKINMGDGAPDPETTLVDGVWRIGQKAVTHYIQLESGADLSGFAVNDIVTLHTRRTSAYGVTNGVDPTDGTAIHRRVVSVDDTNKRLAFDRPVFWNYHVPMVATPVSGAAGTYYAFVTKASPVGMCLVLGSRGGVLGATAQPLAFYEPKPIDDFDSVWRYSYDMVLGHNVWNQDLFELHFAHVSLPKPGGIVNL